MSHKKHPPLVTKAERHCCLHYFQQWLNFIFAMLYSEHGYYILTNIQKINRTKPVMNNFSSLGFSHISWYNNYLFFSLTSFWWINLYFIYKSWAWHWHKTEFLKNLHFNSPIPQNDWIHFFLLLLIISTMFWPLHLIYSIVYLCSTKYIF